MGKKRVFLVEHKTLSPFPTKKTKLQWNNNAYAEKKTAKNTGANSLIQIGGQQMDKEDRPLRLDAMSVDLLCRMLESYIRSHTVRNQYGYMTYIGRPSYLEAYKEGVKYLDEVRGK